MNLENEDHYIPDDQNAHIDTCELKNEINNLYETRVGEELEKANLWPKTYESILSCISSNPPEEPSEKALICRYLTPTKFLWFACQEAVYFCGADKFEDKTDSDIPEDYKNCISRILCERNVQNQLLWEAYLDAMRSHWLVSCWTSLDNHYDDYLLWHRYAGDKYGVGITIHYGDLKKELEKSCKNEPHVRKFESGYVGYRHPLRLPPFNKRNIYRNEKEVRFVCKAEVPKSFSVVISSLKKHFSLRFSPDAPTAHVNSIRAVWKKMGGSDKYYIAGN